MVASRCPYRLLFRAAAISASTSEPVRYSRVRSTVEFPMVGPASPPACESMKNAPPRNVTVEQLVISSTVSGGETRVSQTVAKTFCRLRCFWHEATTPPLEEVRTCLVATISAIPFRQLSFTAAEQSSPHWLPLLYCPPVIWLPPLMRHLMMNDSCALPWTKPVKPIFRLVL